MTETPDVIVFDVNETLSDISPLGEAFTAVGAPAHLAATWFAGILRDGFAITAAGGNTAFAEIAQDSLARLLAQTDAPVAEDATEAILGVLKSLEGHPDVVAGIAALAPMAKLVTLSNGSAKVAEALLSAAGVRQHFTDLLSVDDAPGWEPTWAAYAYAAAECGHPVHRMLLVAVHPWDIHGAHAAEMRMIWLNRTGASYPAYFTIPDIQAPNLPSLAAQLTGTNG